MQLIEKYFPSLSEAQKEKFQQLGPLYNSWNARINVISRKDISNLYIHHVLHSLAIARIISFKPQTIVLDAGTGGGFPGIPLAILFPEVEFVLVDSVTKKIKVVEAIVQTLKLKNCRPVVNRVEKLFVKADFVVSRAVTDVPLLYSWIRHIIKPGGNNLLPNGLFCLKGGDISKELQRLGKEVKIYELSHYFDEPFFTTKKLLYMPV
jgi:16S rRNA (guanine527-N7)-methyltransferase